MTLLPAYPLRCRTRTFVQGAHPAFRRLDIRGTWNLCTIAGYSAWPYGTREGVLFRTHAAWNEIRPKNNGGTRFRKKPEHFVEVRAPVRVWARAHHRIAASRRAGVAHRDPPRIGRGASSGRDGFSAFARWRTSGRRTRRKTIRAAIVRRRTRQRAVLLMRDARRAGTVRMFVSHRESQTSRAGAAIEVRASRGAWNPHQ
jgi:hypothetical protein